MRHTIPILALPLLLASCKEQSTNPEITAPSETIEVLKHNEGKFSKDRDIPVGEIGTSFNVDAVNFTIKHRWPHAETTRSVTDDADRSNHAIEVSWSGDDGDSRWIFQTDSDDTVSSIEALNALVRLTPPGTRPPVPNDDSFPAQVQIRSQGALFDLPEVGGEVFEGWTLKSIKTYQHALMDEQYGVTEAEDAGFANRVLEAHLTDGKGTEERHLAFLDHPELTRGIHPEILPVARLAGNGASQSRLVVCTPVPPATEKHVVQLSPSAQGQGLTAHIWLMGTPTYTSRPITDLPAEIPLPDGATLRLNRHFTKAHSEIKWERSDSPKTGPAKPALLIEHQASHHQREAFVLINGEVTPCRIGPKHIMLRYAIGDQTAPPLIPPSADSGKTPETAPAPPSPTPPAPSS